MTGVKQPWQKRPLPPDWGAEEILFFTNWMRELSKLHRILTCTAVDRLKILRRARKLYLKLGYSLNEQIRRVTIQPGDPAKSHSTAKGVRQ